MPIAALTGFVVFAFLAFGVRSWIHYRRTGTSGFVGISGAVGSIEWFGGVLFVVAMLAAVGAPIAQLAGFVAPSELFSNRMARVAGLGLLVAGMAATLWAQFAMGESWRVGVDASARTMLIESGPFRWVRNPIFSAMALATVGLTLLVPNIVALLSLMSLLVALEIQVRRIEEPYLTATHGEDYRRYAGGTGRFIPGIGRLHPVVQVRADP